MTMKQAHEDDSLKDLSGTLSSTHINTEENLTADKLLDELPVPQHPQQQQQDGLYMNNANASSRNTYDQFFEEVSLDLPRDAQHYHQQQDAEPPSRLMKFMPRRAAAAATADNTITPSDISGPFYSISDVLDDSVSPTATAAAMAAASASHHHHGNGDTYESIDMSQPTSNPRAARRNVNEAEVVVTSGGASIPTRRKSTLNPFKRSKSISQKPSPLETVISKTRPRMLPPKDPHEEKKHLQEYESMMKQAKKLEAKKQRESNKKREEKDKKASYAIYTWENDIIPHWKSRIKDKRTMVLWDQGIPPRCRRKVWCLKIGNPLNITKNTFSECTRRVPQAVRQTSKSANTTTTTTNGDSHGAPMPIVTANHHTTYDPYHPYPHSASATTSSEQVYRRTRQRRTSSLDVLRERKEDRHGHHAEDDDEDDEDGHKETQDRVAGFSNFTNMPTQHASSSTYSFTSNEDHFDRYSQSEGGRSALELGSLQGEDDDDDDSIGLEDDDEDDEETDTISDQEEGNNNDDKVLRDPAAINFLNKAIDEDILRTLPSLCVFQPDGPLFMSLRKVLHAYVGYRPNMTYSRGASFLAGVLLLNMGAQDTFSALINMISASQVLSALYNADEKKIQGFFKVFNVIFAENLPKLYLHFKNLTLTPDNYLPDWFMTVFASIIPLELSSRLWDIYLLHGDIILFRTGLVVLKYLEPLLWGGGFSETVKILNRGFVGEHRGEEVKAALAVSGHITEGDEDPFFDEILGRKGVHLSETRFNELLGAHMPRSATANTNATHST
ncbi:rab-GTPase-TBC domain-containing protein [Mucor lusitanicus]|uniref:Rab-GTPase-TBC domain-containing protein n=1 Tax=Mucor circinelloides f. lusitanicus TaxID=29924 RepID=A0A8H4BHN2_MUCCL|nr:rab-GTPase-TBC domain-containing protein [Mucor lusitanicus]